MSTPDSKREHVMIDIETLDTVASAAIIAIGAVHFNIQEKAIKSGYHSFINLQSNWEAGRTTSSETLDFWIQETKKGNETYELAETTGGALGNALSSFVSWLEFVPNNPLIWAASPNFDCKILDHAISSFDESTPWKFYNERDYRTLRKTFPHVKPDDYGTLHNALDDATRQAEHVIKIYHTVPGLL